MNVWGIINVTPDSFWAGSRVKNKKELLAVSEKALSHGAAVLDIGGFSTRPGYEQVSEDEEFERLAKALTVIKHQFPEAPLSIDTFRSSIVRRLHSNFGKFIVNDIQGGVLDVDMYSTVGELGLDYVMMSSDADIEVMELFFATQIKMARNQGVRGRIIVDPGFGFGKTTEQNFVTLKQMERLQKFGDILVGVSRKSMIWRTLKSAPADSLAGTCAIHWQALAAGASILRAHDVRQAVEVCLLYEQYRSL